MIMTEMINKWEVVEKLIQLENEYNFHKEEWDAQTLYRKLCEMEIAIGKTPGANPEQEKELCEAQYRAKIAESENAKLKECIVRMALGRYGVVND